MFLHGNPSSNHDLNNVIFKSKQFFKSQHNFLILNFNDIFNHAYREFPLTVVSPQPVNGKENVVDWEPIRPYHFIYYIIH